MKKLSSDLKNNYITIQSWMVEELELRGNTLMIFALIYGFSQVGNQVCTCGDEYMAAWINSSTRCVLNCKNELLDKKLIEKVVLKGDSRVSGYRAERCKNTRRKFWCTTRNTRRKFWYNSKNMRRKFEYCG